MTETTTVLQTELLEMADGKGEIAYTSNTRDLLDQAVSEGLAVPVSGKFRMVEPHTLNSIYRLRGASHE